MMMRTRQLYCITVYRIPFTLRDAAVANSFLWLACYLLVGTYAIDREWQQQAIRSRDYLQAASATIQ